jgi:hypothetical protein
LRKCTYLLGALLLANPVTCISSQDQRQLAQSPVILSAKTVYFDNRTGSDAVGKAALTQLKKWGRFQIVQDKKQADLIFLLSASAYRGGYIILAGGQTGTIDSNGPVRLDPVPDPGWHAPVRSAFLTVIDPKTGNNLWSDSHIWGGLLTGTNSAGERLIKELQKQMKQ